jgi:hypothetical protein
LLYGLGDIDTLDETAMILMEFYISYVEQKIHELKIYEEKKDKKLDFNDVKYLAMKDRAKYYRFVYLQEINKKQKKFKKFTFR